MTTAIHPIGPSVTIRVAPTWFAIVVRNPYRARRMEACVGASSPGGRPSRHGMPRLSHRPAVRSASRSDPVRKA